jgi:hypothetical protein
MRKKGWLLLAFLATVLGNVMKMDPKDYGLINYKDTKTKCRLYWCLIEFIDW